MTITTPPTRTRAPQPGRSLPNRTQPSRTAQPGRTQPGKAQPGRTPADSSSPRARSAASQRAYARKAQRQSVQSGTGRVSGARRTPFVLVVMGLLAVGLVTSLWLTTAASADSYRLEQAQLQARELAERSAQLRQEVANLQTAPELARQARELGMVPSGEPARLVVQPDGTVVVVGKPAPATVPAPATPPAPPAPPVDPAAAVPPVDPAAPPVDPAAPPVDPAAGQPPVDPAQPPAGGPAAPNPPPAGGG